MTALALLLLLAATGGSPAQPLTPDGWGPVRIGMSRAEVEKALSVELEGEPLEDEYSCIEMVAKGPDRGVWFMFEEYRLARISIGSPSRMTTPRGIGIGASAEAVRRAYGSRLEVEPHYYEDLPSEYLTYWTVPGKRGVRFETDSKRRVQTIHAGTDAIRYVEGCA